ncbi:unnamed protein product [Soboliphyme baturini]|uniref:Ovule protein n=1 Tax=Soboliphyme baturini TaxID=241478 RepID=A0A183IMR8_9BILA|nr:unnamed protein product [Soboliphyme baturini]
MTNNNEGKEANGRIGSQRGEVKDGIGSIQPQASFKPPAPLKTAEADQQRTIENGGRTSGRRRVVWSSGKVPLYYTKAEIFEDMLPRVMDELASVTTSNGSKDATEDMASRFEIAREQMSIHQWQGNKVNMSTSKVPPQTMTTTTMKTTLAAAAAAGNPWHTDKVTMNPEALEDNSLAEYVEIMNSGIFKEQGFEESLEDQELLPVRKQPQSVGVKNTNGVHYIQLESKHKLGDGVNDSLAIDRVNGTSALNKGHNESITASFDRGRLMAKGTANLNDTTNNEDASDVSSVNHIYCKKQNTGAVYTRQINDSFHQDVNLNDEDISDHSVRKDKTDEEDDGPRSKDNGKYGNRRVHYLTVDC